MKNTICSLCGKDISMIYIHENKAYGSECIKKVTNKEVQKISLKKWNSYEIIKKEYAENNTRVDLLVKISEDDEYKYYQWTAGYRLFDENNNITDKIHNVVNNHIITTEKIKRGSIMIKKI